MGTRRRLCRDLGGIGARCGLLALTALVLLGGLSPRAALARTDQIFTIANFPVDARADDAVTAKERAIADGQQAALRALLKRLVPVTAYTRLKKLGQIKSGELIEGVAVRSERNSSTEYIASLDFSFQPDAVRRLLRSEGIPFIEAQAPATVVIPVLAGGADRAGPISGASWQQVWKGLDLTHALTPVRIDARRPSLTADAIKALQSGDLTALRAQALEARSDRVVVAIADFDAQSGKLTVTLAGQDAVGPIVLRRSYRANRDPAYALELSAVVALATIEGRWKAVSAQARGGIDVLAGPGEPVQVLVEFRTMAQWQEVRRQLMEISGVEDLTVGGISARRADIQLRFPGGGAQLAQAISGQGFTMINDGGVWVLRPNY